MVSGLNPPSVPNQRPIILTTFLAHALAAASIFTRIPDLQKDLALSEAVLGLALTALPVAGLIANIAAGRVIEAVGTRAIVTLGIPLMAVFSATAALAPNLPLLLISFIGLGIAFSLANVAMNVEADRIETATGRRVMNRCHGIWGAGMLASSLIGAAARGTGVSAEAHLGAMIVPIALMSLMVLTRLEGKPVKGADTIRRAGLSLPTRATLVVMLFGIAAGMSQAGAQNWSVIYLRDTFTAPDWVDSLTIPAFLATMTLGRLFADTWIERFGAVRVALTQTGLATLGALAVIAAPSAWFAVAGFAVMGAGSGVHFPLAISAAAKLGDRPAAENVSAVILSMSAAMLAAPAIMGAIAEGYGLRMAFAAILPTLLISLALTPRVLARL